MLSLRYRRRIPEKTVFMCSSAEGPQSRSPRVSFPVPRSLSSETLDPPRDPGYLELPKSTPATEGSMRVRRLVVLLAAVLPAPRRLRRRGTPQTRSSAWSATRRRRSSAWTRRAASRSAPEAGRPGPLRHCHSPRRTSTRCSSHPAVRRSARGPAVLPSGPPRFEGKVVCTTPLRPRATRSTPCCAASRGAGSRPLHEVAGLLPRLPRRGARQALAHAGTSGPAPSVTGRSRRRAGAGSPRAGR